MVQRVTADSGRPAEADQEDPEYVKTMAQRGETGQVSNSDDSGQDNNNNEIPSMPEDGFEKFYNKETGEYDWASHAKDAEWRLQQSKSDRDKSQNQQQQQQDNTQQDQQDNQQQQAKDELENRGLDFDSLSQEYQENGELSQESYASLQKAGIPKEVVDQYIAGQEAVIQQTREQTFQMVGGEETYTNMLQWAESNLEQSDIDAYNRAVDSGDMAQVRIAVQGLKAQYEAAEGTEPNLVSKGQSSTAGGEAFASWDEVTEAMSDKRYGVDPAYTAKIEHKIARSKLS